MKYSLNLPLVKKTIIVLVLQDDNNHKVVALEPETFTYDLSFDPKVKIIYETYFFLFDLHL